MDSTAGTRTHAGGAMIVMAGGLAVLLKAAQAGDSAYAIAGATVTATGLILLSLISVRRWTTDTRAERALLAAATREADDMRMKYTAASAAMEAERHRRLRDAEAERQSLQKQLEVERAAMRAEFEDERDALITRSVEAGVRMVITGGLDHQAEAVQAQARLIEFPKQQERAREKPRGVRP